jgi:hypothetical protein
MMKSLAQCDCGGQPTARSLSYLRGRWFWVQCSRCQARSSDRTTLDEAVTDWNQRGKSSKNTEREPRAPRASRARRQG